MYSPFGQVTSLLSQRQLGQGQDTSPNHNTILFAGQSLDTATGLYYDHARWYSPGSGTFLTRDLMGYAAGDPNLYRYCGQLRPGQPTDPDRAGEVEERALS